MNQFGLILATGLLLVACWTTTVSSRSLDVNSESEGSISEIDPVNAPTLEFEGGLGDEDAGSRDKRTPRFLFRTVSCLFTFLINPSCLQGITGGAGGGGSSSGGSLSGYGSNRRQQSSSQPYYMISLPRFNDSDSNGTATEYPIYPIESTSEYPDEPPRPTNPLMQLIQWKMNLIPNMLRRFFPGFGGGRRDDGGSGGGGIFSGLLGNAGGGGNGGGLLASLGGLGQGRLAALFGGRGNAVGGGGGGGLGLGGLGFGQQY